MVKKLKSYKKYNNLDIRNRRLTWVFIIFFLLAVGIIRGERVALVLAETMFALIILTWLYTSYIIRKITVQQVVANKAIEDDFVSVQLHISTTSWLPIRWICVKNYFGAETHSERHKEYIIVQLDFFEKKYILNYMACCSAGRGKYRVGPIEIVITGPLGIWMQSRVLKEKKEILVLPSIVRLTSLSPTGRQKMTFYGNNTKQKTGTSYEFCGTREYRNGDNLRYIHWPATAKIGKLIIKEFQQVTTSRITIFVDLYHKALQGYRPTNLDYAIKIAGSIAKYAVDNSFDFRFIAKGKVIYHFPFGKNMVHLNWLLEEMALMKPNGDKSLLQLLKQFMNEINGGEELFIVFSQMGNNEEYLQILTSLQRRQVSITAIFLVANTFRVLQEYDSDVDFNNCDLAQLCAQKGMQVIMVERGCDIARSFQGV